MGKIWDYKFDDLSQHVEVTRNGEYFTDFCVDIESEYGIIELIEKLDKLEQSTVKPVLEDTEPVTELAETGQFVDVRAVVYSYPEYGGHEFDLCTKKIKDMVEDGWTIHHESITTTMHQHEMAVQFHHYIRFIKTVPVG